MPMELALYALQSHDVVSRIWAKDHTVWKSDPTEISDRLGWLDVTSYMRSQVGSLEAFAAEVKADGIKHVVLLGMGGSSLGPEVLKQVIGSSQGYPELIVLDSTVPAWISSVSKAINPAQTLFIVSSKSGGTIEPNTLYRHFRALVESSVGQEDAGCYFTAVTDPGSALEALAERDGFRKVFLNPADIGGRYSVQSFFGLLPAALAGMDLSLLIKRLDDMAALCGTGVDVRDNVDSDLDPALAKEAEQLRDKLTLAASPPLTSEDKDLLLKELADIFAGVTLRDNPGAVLGATMAAMAKKGRDKLTLVASPRVAAFGLWAEQLLAESTGKEGKGIIPVADEPLLGPEAYGDDRLFVHLRLSDDDNSDVDNKLEALLHEGHAIIRLELDDIYDVASEFFRWEFATAVAGSILGIQPFDQPNVQQAKDMTDKVLSEYQSTGVAPVLENLGSVGELLALAKPGDYFAIMAYVEHTDETDSAMRSLREAVMRRYKIATTFGYGPRFLHSTGQLHKGGPDSGLFLQITSPHIEDIVIPGLDYSFGVLADSQASGDMDALVAQGRRVARVVAEGDVVATIRQLVDQLSS